MQILLSLLSLLAAFVAFSDGVKYVAEGVEGSEGLHKYIFSPCAVIQIQSLIPVLLSAVDFISCDGGQHVMKSEEGHGGSATVSRNYAYARLLDIA